jgi:hypothetical protein
MRQSVYRPKNLTSFRDVVCQYQPIGEPSTERHDFSVGERGNGSPLPQRFQRFAECAAPVKDDHSIDRNLLRWPQAHAIDVFGSRKVELAAHQARVKRYVSPKLVHHDVGQGADSGTPSPGIDLPLLQNKEEPKLDIAVTVALTVRKRAVDEGCVQSLVGVA